METKSFRVLALITVLCSMVLLGALSAAKADISPAGCDTNALVMTLTRTPNNDHNGDVIQYTVTVTNLSVTGACDVTDVAVTFTAPAADGTATGTTTTLGTGLSFPVGTTMTWNSTGSGGAIANAALAVTLALNPSVTTATAKANFTGILHDAPNNDVVNGEKTVSVLVLHPSIAVTKTVNPETSKAGDSVTYHICVTNTSDDDDTLNGITVTDSILGDISASFPSSLTVGQTACADIPYTVKVGDPDPLVNTVTASGTDIASTPQTVTSPPASASVDLIHPNIDITKTPDTLFSTVGGTVNYTVCITNTGDVNLKNVVVTDDLLGALTFPGTLAVGATECVTVPRVVLQGDPDPLVNCATVHANPDVPGVEFTNDITDTACATVDLLQPDIQITKQATPTTSKAGDTVSYEICVSNPGQIDLTNITVSDNLLGDLSSSFADTLAVGGSECHTFPYVVQPGDPDPLVNIVTVTGNPSGSAVTLTDTSSATVDLVHPSFTITKSCSPDPVAVGGTLTWTITLVNTGDVSLDIHTVDPTMGIDQTDTVLSGGTQTITGTHVVVVGDPNPITNTATATATLSAPLNEILNNVIGPQTDDASCSIQQGGPTRTQGYWFTHPQQLKDAFECITGSETGSITLCGNCTVDANGAMAIFWRVTGGNSNLATQLLAAMFNQCEFGTTAPDSIIQNGLDVLCDPNATAAEIGAATDALDAFNSSGDNLPFPAGFVNTAANTKTAKAMANAGTIPSCITGKKGQSAAATAALKNANKKGSTKK